MIFKYIIILMANILILKYCFFPLIWHFTKHLYSISSCASLTSYLYHPRNRKWQPTPVFLPGQFHGQTVSESPNSLSRWHTFHSYIICYPELSELYMMLSLRYFIFKVPVHLILGQYFFCVSYWFIFVITTSFLKSSLWGLHLYRGCEVNT